MDIQVKSREKATSSSPVPTDEEKKGSFEAEPNQLVQSEPWSDDSESPLSSPPIFR